MPSKETVIKVLEADPDGRNKGGFFRYLCEWPGEEGDMSQWCSCKNSLTTGHKYKCTLTQERTRNGKIRYTISNEVGANNPAPAGVPVSTHVDPLALMDKAAELADLVHTRITKKDTALVVIKYLLEAGCAVRMVEDEYLDNEQGGSDLPPDNDIPF